jgi:hypothetical protein
MQPVIAADVLPVAHALLAERAAAIVLLVLHATLQLLVSRAVLAERENCVWY